jgi:hypothetical protein
MRRKSMTATTTRTSLLERFYGPAPDADAPTERQLGFLFDLAGDRAFPRLGGTCGEERIENLAALLENTQPSRRAVSQMIDDLRRAPRDADNLGRCPLHPAYEADYCPVCGTTTPISERTQPAPAEPVTPGVYEVEGEVFVVKPNREKTRVYAKKLVEIRSERLTETGEHVQIEFEYAPGAIRKIRPEHRMDVERAKALTIRYGRCIVCGRRLKAAQSVEQGIGPVCIKSFGGVA